MIVPQQDRDEAPQQHRIRHKKVGFLVTLLVLSNVALLRQFRCCETGPWTHHGRTKTLTNHQGSFTSDESTEEEPFEYPSGFPTALPELDVSKSYDTCVVGAGLSGTVFAERTANLLDQSVLVMDVRPHIAGNCYDFVDPRVGILRSLYGAHLFHTKLQRVWDYIHSNPKAPEWTIWYHTVQGVINGTTYFPIPANIVTVNTLMSLRIQNDQEMAEWLQSVQVPCDENICQNGQEMAKSRVGEELYKMIFETYTMKQWGIPPQSLNASVTARIPVRPNFDPRYFDDKWQVLPSKGYTEWFRAMLEHEHIDVVLSTDFFDYQKHLEQNCGRIVYTGPIDQYFAAAGYPKLEYRSIEFHERVYYNHSGYVLPAPVVNYPGGDVPYTRSVEYKHFLHQTHSPHSLVVSETTTDDGAPYYPVPTERNLELYAKYKTLARELEKKGKIIFVGRLANYKYFNMDQAIDNALQVFYDLHPQRK